MASKADEYATLGEILSHVLRERNIVLAAVGVFATVAMVVALARPVRYASSFIFLPSAPQDAGRAGLANLAGQFGINVAAGLQAESPDLYVALLNSRDLLVPLLNDSVKVDSAGSLASVSQLLDVDAESDAEILEESIKKVREDVLRASVDNRGTGLVSVSVVTPSAVASNEIAVRLIGSLNRFNVERRQSQARAERQFIEARLEDASTELRNSEQRLEAFLRSNRRVDGSPELRFEQQRLQRQVDLHAQIVTTFSQQLEDARVREVRDTPVITVIQSPSIAVKPLPRRRLLIVAAGVVLGMFGGVVAVLVRGSTLVRVDGRSPN